jgi:5-methylcytosine-specific restriction protein B
VAALLDVMFEERSEVPLAAYKAESESIQSTWFTHLMPDTRRGEIIDLLKHRRYVILQGPPGTGKTRMAGMILANDYAGFGRSIQFHPNTTYEHFVGGLAPAQAHRMEHSASDS